VTRTRVAGAVRVGFTTPRYTTAPASSRTAQPGATQRLVLSSA
jgi:hypothetical protein